MRMNVYTIKDTASGVYGNPNFMHSDKQALREFEDIVNDKDGNKIAMHPADFIMFRIGTYDTTTGVIEPENHTRIALALDLLKLDPPEYDLFNTEGATDAPKHL